MPVQNGMRLNWLSRDPLNVDDVGRIRHNEQFGGDGGGIWQDASCIAVGKG